MEQQKWYQIDFYIGLYNLDELSDNHTFKESVNKITELLGDCTIIPCTGSYKHPIGIRITMNSLKVTKFTNNISEGYINTNVNELKDFFNQNSIITNIIECNKLQFNH